MRERRVVEVLAHVILVEPHRTVGGESQVLGVDQVHRDGGRSRVFQHHVPEPGGCRLGQGQHDREPDALPFAGPTDLLAVGSDASRARWAQQRDRFDDVADAPEVEVGGTAFDLVAGEEVEEDFAMVEPAERAVGVELDAKAGRAREAEGGEVETHDRLGET
jgi:hypothetical protein